ncbi:Bug family tripartite tricarboxylate transporter substrate binding protein [Roseomonas populi]|uniref:Tripartite tricarboxylate transporter substrate binding protein n=1 Tax=Roseomonas populi TaxID=3121582 RepID=A0ABT1X7W2_9PROT|nr:tripartite tricarboxylate transporter substrate binding protein [Roseomonas pecuniae]MCR0983799.1 tripartite tricarboxylate transporter substrate binding protein [Roseomonas pecuniae]
MRRRAAVALLGLTGLSAAAKAQPAPGRSIRLIVPYAPGGGTDILSRLIAAPVGDALGAAVVVENRPGGNSAIGTEAVARATPDGQTIGMIDLAFLVNPSLFSLPYDTLRDFTAISLVATTPLVLMVNPRLGVRTMAELVSHIRANAGKVSFASAGVGTAVHIAGEQLRLALGTDLLHVPYRGGSLPANAVLTGEVTLAFLAQSQAGALATGGQAVAIGITSASRSAALPDVPTMGELGLPTVDAQTINGLIAPAGTPGPILERISTAVADAVKRPDMLKRMAELGCDPAASSPAQFSDWIRAEVAKWREVVRAAKIQPQ